MKIRSSFVSNSSSASFIVSLRKLSIEQLCKILNHNVWGKKLGLEYADSDSWCIGVGNGMLSGNTSMDNFDMAKFMEMIGVTGVTWGDSYSELKEDEVAPCDKLCDNCQLRFVCYTNEYGKGNR